MAGSFDYIKQLLFYYEGVEMSKGSLVVICINLFFVSKNFSLKTVKISLDNKHDVNLMIPSQV